MIYFTEDEWARIKEKLVSISPKTLLILVVFILGFAFGWNMKATDISADCKYSGAFRINFESYGCSRKL